MSNNRIVTYDELKTLSGYSSPAEVIAWMEREGVAKMLGKHNRPCTTVDAINTAMGISYDSQPQSRVVGL